MLKTISKVYLDYLLPNKHLFASLATLRMEGLAGGLTTKNMLETSSDLLNIVIAFCVLWFTVFVCWFIYYIVMIMKRVTDTADQLTKMAGNVSDFVGEAKKRLRNATSYVPLVVEGVKSLTEYLKEKQGEASKSKAKSKTESGSAKTK